MHPFSIKVIEALKEIIPLSGVASFNKILDAIYQCFKQIDIESSNDINLYSIMAEISESALTITYNV